MDQQKKIYKARQLPLRISVHHLCISIISTSQHTILQPQVTSIHKLLSQTTTFSSVSPKRIPVQVLQDHSTLAKTQQVRMTGFKRTFPAPTEILTQIHPKFSYLHNVSTLLKLVSPVCLFYLSNFIAETEEFLAFVISKMKE